MQDNLWLVGACLMPTLSRELISRQYDTARFALPTWKKKKEFELWNGILSGVKATPFSIWICYLLPIPAMVSCACNLLCCRHPYQINIKNTGKYTTTTCISALDSGFNELPNLFNQQLLWCSYITTQGTSCGNQQGRLSPKPQRLNQHPNAYRTSAIL